MTDNNKYVETHELYGKFCQWLGVSNIAENTYSMINYSLHTAELYLNTQYGISTTLSTNIDLVASNSNFQFPNSPTKIINMFKNGKVCYPNVNYLDTTNFSIIKEIGEYSTDLSDVRLSGDFTSIYLTGYVQKTSLLELNTPNEEYKLNPPIFEINSSSVISPITTYIDSFDLTVTGDIGSKVFVNEVEVGSLGNEGKLDIPVTLTQEVSDMSVKLTDSTGSKDSNTSTLVFIKSVNIPTPMFYILGYSTRVNTKNIEVRIAKPPMSKLSYKRNGVTITLDDDSNAQTVTTVTLPFETSTPTSKVIMELFVTKDDIHSKSEFILVDYSESFSTEYLKELNKEVTFTPYMPEDLMVGMFKLANHFYKGTLYNNANTDKYSTSLGESATYTSHTIPKDIKSLITSYITY